MDTKIILSDKELELVCNTEWILTKHAVIQKVYQLFGKLLPEIEKLTIEKRSFLPSEVFTNSPKISKGENYQLLPYVMLDYPRFFGNGNTLAIRTFFWWGNFFSVNLQLAGDFKDSALEKLNRRFTWLQHHGYFICVNESPWEHHYGQDNFISLALITEKDFWDILGSKSFVKISKKIPVENWQEAPGFMVMAFTELLELVQKN